ncbi:MAG: hypothetical protein AB8G22_08345 [Saprospiraceae bacterium]
MKKIFLLSTFTCAALILSAQVSDLVLYNQKRLNTNKTAMTILGAWAVGNIAVGATLQGKNKGTEAQYFHRMNAYWNVVNLGLAAAGLYAATKGDPASYDAFQTVQEQHKIQKVLLFNAGLDVGYVMAGFYLLERGKNSLKNQERLRGFGKSLILQGAFLFLFDWVVFATHASRNEGLRQFIGGLSFNGDAVGWNMVF